MAISLCIFVQILSQKTKNILIVNIIIFIYLVNIMNTLDLWISFLRKAQKNTLSWEM
jgi:hypothetical protein